MSVDRGKRFPEMVAAVAMLPGRTLVLDGEIAVFDRQLRSRFEWLREGMVAKDEASPYVGGKTRLWLKVKVAWGGPSRATSGADRRIAEPAE